MDSGRSIIPILLAGGAGNRLWPISTATLPKQFLKFFDKKYSLFQKTALRLKNSSTLDFSPPLVLTAEHYAEIVQEQLDEIELEPLAILLEPTSKNTAPSILAALFFLEKMRFDKDLLLLPTDHYLEKPSKVYDCIEEFLNYGTKDKIFTFGISPDRPETGYGYIKIKNANHKKISHVERFVEKPSLEEAELMIKDQSYLWNSGMFFCEMDTLKDAFNAVADYLTEPVAGAISAAKNKISFLLLIEKAGINVPLFRLTLQ